MSWAMVAADLAPSPCFGGARGAGVRIVARLPASYLNFRAQAGYLCYNYSRSASATVALRGREIGSYLYAIVCNRVSRDKPASTFDFISS